MMSTGNGKPSVSVVTPTFGRPAEVSDLIANLSAQTVLPEELVIVDGAGSEETATEETVSGLQGQAPFRVTYLRSARGTAVQRNAGIEVAEGDFIALIDDDVRLEPEFIKVILKVFRDDKEMRIGGIVGYRKNRHFRPEETRRWRWYRRLGLLKTFEPGRYDFECGYPINNDMQPPFKGTRPVDFMTTACAVWRRQVFESGLRFDEFFSDYGILEDAHFSLNAGRNWTLLQCGDALCDELHSPNGRIDRSSIGYKCVVNYYYVFNDVARPLTPGRKFRFWRYQAFEIFRLSASSVRRWRWADMDDVFGRMKGVAAVLRGKGGSFS